MTYPLPTSKDLQPPADAAAIRSNVNRADSLPTTYMGGALHNDRIARADAHASRSSEGDTDSDGNSPSDESEEDTPPHSVPIQPDLEDDLASQVLRGGPQLVSDELRQRLQSYIIPEDLSLVESFLPTDSESSDENSASRTMGSGSIQRRSQLLRSNIQSSQHSRMAGQRAKNTLSTYSAWTKPIASVTIPQTKYARGRRMLLPRSGLPLVTVAMRGDVQFLDQKRKHVFSPFEIQSEIDTFSLSLENAFVHIRYRWTRRLTRGMSRTRPWLTRAW